MASSTAQSELNLPLELLALTEKEEKPTISSLPGEIMFDIFSRLSIKDLSPCRFVSKDWYSAIKNPDFRQLYNSQIIQEEADSRLAVYTYYYTPSGKFFIVDDHGKIGAKLRAEPLAINCWLQETAELVGSANGLMCLYSSTDYRSYYIFNPVIREAVCLPKPSFLIKPYEEEIVLFTGFGFDATTKTYKVVLARFIFSNAEVIINIHTVGSGEWRNLPQKFRCTCIALYKCGVFLNNVLHWELPDQIVAIDLGTEIYTRFKKPATLDGWTTSTLCSLDGSLCMLQHTYEGEYLWMMKEYGAEGSWTKKNNLPHNMLVPLFTKNGWSIWKVLITMKALENGNIMFHDAYRQIYYNLESRQHQVTVIKGLPKKKMQFIACIGSLISPRTIAAGIGINVPIRKTNK